jgi:hypothetical protein
MARETRRLPEVNAALVSVNAVEAINFCLGFFSCPDELLYRDPVFRYQFAEWDVTIIIEVKSYDRIDAHSLGLEDMADQ